MVKMEKKLMDLITGNHLFVQFDFHPVADLHYELMQTHSELTGI